MKNPSFDRIAGIYDGLASVVFGGAIRRAQVKLIRQQMPSSGRVLILGGGTGWILEEISKVSPGLEIDYVELSAKMLRKAQQRTFRNVVHFIHGDHEFQSDRTYDVICTFFFLDVFSREQLSSVIEVTLKRLKPEGRWLIVDFDEEKCAKGWRKALVKLMHWFFGVTTRLPAQELYDFPSFFPANQVDWEPKDYFYSGMIFTVYGRKVVIDN